MSKITIIEGNSDDKDQVRNYMVKGEPGNDGVSPTLEASRTGTTTTVTITDAEGEKDFELYDGVSPTITSSKTGSTTTLTIVDAEGTKTATIQDGATANIIDSNHLSDDTTQTYSGRIINENFAGLNTHINNTFFPKENIAVIDFSVVTPSGSYEEVYPIDFPTGFTKHNSVLLSAMVSLNPAASVSALWEPIENSLILLDDSVLHAYSIEFGDFFNQNPDKINLRVTHKTPTQGTSTKYFRIVLMKFEIDTDITDYELGDVNMDREVKQADLDLLQGYLQGTQALTSKQFKLADMNEDGTLNSSDVLLLTQKINS